MPLPYSKPFVLDPAVLGQMMTAENFIPILPTKQKIGEFASGVIEKTPGVSACRLCIGGVLSPARQSPALFCRNCTINFECPETRSRSKCSLHEDTDFLSLTLETASNFWGFLFIEVADSDQFDPYHPFIKNFCNHIAIHLENRHHRKELRFRNEKLKKQHNALETLVRLRTKELAESEEKFSSAFRNAPLLMTISSLDDGIFLDVNDAFIEATGYSREVAIGSTAVEIGWITAEERNRIINLLKKGGRVKNFEIAVNCADGSQLFCLYSGEVIEFGGKKRLLSTAIDITKQKALELSIQQAQRMKSIGALAGGIAHDFNNILFPIVGMSEMLLEDLPAGSIERENAEEIFRAGQRGSDLVKQILAFSRQSDHKMVPTRVQPILKEVLKLSRSTIPSYIDIQQQIQPDCSMIMADPTQIHQVAMNIITNAYHAMEDKGGQMTVQLKQVELMDSDCAEKNLAPGKYALLSFSDTGHGISDEGLNRIFEPYFTTKEQGKGTGIGLAVVYGIVKEHRGNIEVHSEIGKGSTFDVYLPLLHRAQRAEAAKRVEDCTGGNERILLVDDEAPITKLEKQMLERLGYKVTTRTSSLDALEAFKIDPNLFDLVISDMSMPGMTGDRLARELIAIRPDIPIIICTGFSERLNQEKAAALGVKGFLMKPIVKAEMAKTVRKVLDESNGNDQQ